VAVLARVGVVLVMASLVAACTTQRHVSSSAADSTFVGSVHVGAPDIGTYRSDTELIRMGHAACDDFQAGASYEEIADRLRLQEGSNALPSQDLGVVISSAVEAYCPRFVSDVS
jgi:Protein of unknown function (DUF732)